MNLTPEEIKKMFRNYTEVKEVVEKVTMEVWRLRHPRTEGTATHHGGPDASFEYFYVEGDKIEVALDTGCCGSYDSDWISFPLSYLYEDWKPLEEQRIKEEKESQAALEAKRIKKQQEDKEKYERDLYEKLRKKFES